jgi:putative oxidoreductase
MLDIVIARLRPFAPTVLRLALGAVFLAHGLFKVTVLSFPETVAFFESFGFPGWTAYAVFTAEVIGGLLLIAGIGTRIVTLFLMGVVLGAFRVHAPNGWYFANPNGGWEYLAVLLVALITIALLGPGRLALARRNHAKDPE